MFGVLADDLTGALEIGAKFAAAGIAASVTTRRAWEADATALAIDTETRHTTPAEAAAAIAKLANEARTRHLRLIYKKTDSTLRGHIGAELAALAEAFPGKSVTYVPAYPRMGRTVRDGHLLVDGVPVHLTDFARDPLNPVRESHVPTMMGAARVEVLDAETDADVTSAARALLAGEPPWLAAGPAALAEAMASLLDAPRAAPPAFPRVRRCLVVNGSLHPQSARQAAAMRSDGQWEILNHGGPGIGQAVRERLRDFDALLVFGGDTAFSILKALGCQTMLPRGEVVPGVPVSILPGRELTFLTKAGGFGPVDILASIRSLLSGSDRR